MENEITEPKSLIVVSSDGYDHHLFKCPEGRYFIDLSHESGFLPATEAILLNKEEVTKLHQNMAKFIDELRSTFCHRSRTFTFHKGERLVPQLYHWPAYALALNKWREDEKKKKDR